MASFGGHGQPLGLLPWDQCLGLSLVDVVRAPRNPMALVGHDRFVIHCLRYMSAQMLPMLLCIIWPKVLHMRFSFATSPGFSEVPKPERQALGRLR